VVRIRLDIPAAPRRVVTPGTLRTLAVRLPQAKASTTANTARPRIKKDLALATTSIVMLSTFSC